MPRPSVQGLHAGPSRSLLHYLGAAECVHHSETAQVVFRAHDGAVLAMQLFQVTTDTGDPGPMRLITSGLTRMLHPPAALPLTAACCTASLHACSQSLPCHHPRVSWPALQLCHGMSCQRQRCGRERGELDAPKRARVRACM